VVNLVSYSRFGALRLTDFLAPGAEVVELADWEFMDDRWIGEADGGFTEFLRLEEEPNVVRSVALDLASLPRDTAGAVMRAIGLPLEPRMTEDAIPATLGPPESVNQFPTAPERRTLNFVVGTREPVTSHQLDPLVLTSLIHPH
jgi:hypothetical protein